MFTEHYPFLGVSVAVTEMRCRSMFYTSLGRLLMVDLGSTSEFKCSVDSSTDNIEIYKSKSNRAFESGPLL